MLGISLPTISGPGRLVWRTFISFLSQESCVCDICSVNTCLKFVIHKYCLTFQVLTYLALGQHLTDTNMVRKIKYIVSYLFPADELCHLLCQHSPVALVRLGKLTKCSLYLTNSFYLGSGCGPTIKGDLWLSSAKPGYWRTNQSFQMFVERKL